MAYSDLWQELRGYVPTASPFLLQKFLNRAWSDCRDASAWSFLEGFTVLQVPAVVTTGAITWTQFQNTITGNAAASAVWGPLLVGGTPPMVCASNPAGQPLIGTGGYQIQALNGPLYSIVDANATNPGAIVLTVDRNISEPSQAGIGYQALRAFYGPPSSDWLSWINVINVQEGYAISGRRLGGSQAQLSLIDPQDSSTGDPYFMFSLFADANGMPIRRLWPSPTTQAGLTSIYKRRGTDLSPTVDVPVSFPVQTLLERARQYLAQYQATQPRAPGDETDWDKQWRIHRENYEGDPRKPGSGLLAAAIKQDQSLRTPPPILRRGPGFFPFSSQFAASHDVGRIIAAFGLL